MKTTRRQELRTNVLSQQIDQIGQYVKTNMTILTIVVVGGAVILFGGIWYYNQKTDRLMNHWAQLGSSQTGASPTALIDRYRSVAEAEVNPVLTTTAWLQVGDTALAELSAPKKSTDPLAEPAQNADADDLARVAEDAFTKVIAAAEENLTAYAHAVVAMGVLQENQGNFDEARTWYRKVMDDSRLAHLPFERLAAHRLAGLQQWSESITFPPPPPMVLVNPEPDVSEKVNAGPESPQEAAERASESALPNAAAAPESALSITPKGVVAPDAGTSLKPESPAPPGSQTSSEAGAGASP